MPESLEQQLLEEYVEAKHDLDYLGDHNRYSANPESLYQKTKRRVEEVEAKLFAMDRVPFYDDAAECWSLYNPFQRSV